MIAEPRRRHLLTREVGSLATLVSAACACSDSRVPVEITPDPPPPRIEIDGTYRTFGVALTQNNIPVDPSWRVTVVGHTVTIRGWLQSCAVGILETSGQAVLHEGILAITVDLWTGGFAAIGVAGLEIELYDVPSGTHEVELRAGYYVCSFARDGWPRTFTVTVP